MNKLMKIGIIALSSVLGLVIVLLFCFKKNNATDWQHRQSMSGNVIIQQTPGWYWSLGETINTWPKVLQDEYPVSITFGDGSTATINVLIRYTTPFSEDDCNKFHSEYRTEENVSRSMTAWVTNVMKSTAGIMTASEHAVGRKSEYAQMIMDQVRDGLYQKETTVETKVDQNDPDGKAISVVQTELKFDDNKKPIIERTSSWDAYGIKILEVTLGGTKYDPQTLKSFQVKKAALLAIDEIKAQVRQEQEKGRQKVVEARTMKETSIALGEAEQEKIKIAATAAKQKLEIEAEAKKLAVTQLAELAIIEANKEKEQAEISAQKDLSVAKLTAQSQLEIANAKLAVAEVEAKAATEEAKAIQILAAAEEDRIVKAGAITEKERILAEISAKRDIGVAQFLKDINTPTVVIGGGSNESGSGGITASLINLKLLEATGIIDSTKSSVNSLKPVTPTVKKAK